MSGIGAADGLEQTDGPDAVESGVVDRQHDVVPALLVDDQQPKRRSGVEVDVAAEESVPNGVDLCPPVTSVARLDGVDAKGVIDRPRGS